MKREDAVEYSFILGIPVILAGAVVKLGEASSAEISANFVPLLVGFAVSAIAGYFAICLIKMLVVNDKFHVFAWYTLALGIAVIGLGLYERLNGVKNTYRINMLLKIQKGKKIISDVGLRPVL